ncbi:MAG: Re/Si-specific NAD(P)(+) transhydrogenase subunit alpha [Myxococcota bacterium]|nr:Re/Si-specific NAD(P)(+) transhydrogenase subunit alpha [Myxococcota bacterium]
MRLSIPKEGASLERRVATTPETIKLLQKLNFEVAVERGAGVEAGYRDTDYEEVGAQLLEREALWGEADAILKIAPPTLEEVELMKDGARLISFIWPAQNPELVELLKAKSITALAMDCIPRISRAQKMDALSSMANLSGYRAVIEAAYLYGSLFGGAFTAAGKVRPARVLIIGAGVAGLAAIGAAKALSAEVRAFDVRAATKEQVESMGAQFLEVELEESGDGEGGYAKEMSPAFIEAEMALFRAQAKEVDVVITTALIPGKPAPKLWPADAVELMKPGSVVIDMAAERGGNCPLTRADEVVDVNGVKIVGYTDLASRMAPTASQLYGMNHVHLLRDIADKEGGINIDLEEVITRSAIITHEGETLWPPPPLSELDPASQAKEMKESGAPAEAAEKVEAAPAPAAAEPTPAAPATSTPTASIDSILPTGAPSKAQIAMILIAIVWLLGTLNSDAGSMPSSTRNFINHLTVFALSCFIGWQVIWNVTAALHTPLMSVTNAISGIIIVGGMLHAQGAELNAASVLGGLAIFLATINIVGGFAVTHRMLQMFRK